MKFYSKALVSSSLLSAQQANEDSPSGHSSTSSFSSSYSSYCLWIWWRLWILDQVKVYLNLSNFYIHNISVKLLEHPNEGFNQPVQFVLLFLLRFIHHLVSTLQWTDVLLLLLDFHFLFFDLLGLAEDAVEEGSFVLEPTWVDFGVLVSSLDDGIVLLFILGKEDLVLNKKLFTEHVWIVLRVTLLQLPHYFSIVSRIRVLAKYGSRCYQSTHLHDSEQMIPAWKHSQYFFMQPDFLQAQPLCDLMRSSCLSGWAFLSYALDLMTESNFVNEHIT